MTTQEAIEILTNYSIRNFRSGKTLLTEALTMAISALRSEYMEEQAGADQKAWEEKEGWR